METSEQKRKLTSRNYKELFDKAPFALLLSSTAKMTIRSGVKHFSGGVPIKFNEAFANLIGYEMSEADAISFLELTPEYYKNAEAAQLESLIKTGRYGPYEKEYIRKSGELVPIRLYGQIIEIDSTEYIWSVIQVISKEELEVFNKAPYGIWIYRHSDGQVMAANHSFAEKLGYSVHEVLKRTKIQLFEQTLELENLEESLVADGISQQYNKRYIYENAHHSIEASVQGKAMMFRESNCIWELVNWDRGIRVEGEIVIEPWVDALARRELFEHTGILSESGSMSCCGALT